MRIVNIDKLKCYRELVDCAISEIALREETSISDATMRLAHGLGCLLMVQGGWPRWWSALVVTLDSLERARQDPSSVGQLNPERIVENMRRRTFVATSPYDAAVAAICYLLDEGIDVDLTAEEFGSLYGNSEMSKVVACTPLKLTQDELCLEPFLFETESEHHRRLVKVNCYYRLLVETYEHYSPALKYS